MLSHPQFRQLPMFMTGHELGRMKSGDYPLAGDMDEAKEQARHYDQRRRDSGASRDYRGRATLDDYLSEMSGTVERGGGVALPVHLVHSPDAPTVVMQGHHRVWSSRPNALIPVLHYENRPYDPNKPVQRSIMNQTFDAEDEFRQRGFGLT